MDFNGFTKEDFAIFTIDGLSERMSAIQTTIQPKFREIGEFIVDYLTSQINEQMYVHIAKHARRTVNPPKDTWLAIAHDKRGYKKYPHFQVGLFGDHVFIWLAFIDNLPHRMEIANYFIQNKAELQFMIPKNYVVSLDHTQKKATPMKDLDLDQALYRFANVKKGEFLVGQHITKEQAIVQDGNTFSQTLEQTLKTLLPIYKMALDSSKNSIL